MGDHIDTRGTKKKVKEHDPNARRNRITFKRYVRDLEENLLNLDAEDDEDDLDMFDKDE